MSIKDEIAILESVLTRVAGTAKNVVRAQLSKKYAELATVETASATKASGQARDGEHGFLGRRGA